jgi:hypothetical protein
VTNAHFFFSTKDCRLEINLQVKAQVIAHDGTTSGACTTTTGTTTHASTKEAIKNVTQIDFLSKAAASKGRSSCSITCSRRSNTLFAKPVVLLLEIGVVENFVCTVNVLELLCGILAGIGI